MCNVIKKIVTSDKHSGWKGAFAGVGGRYPVTVTHFQFLIEGNLCFDFWRNFHVIVMLL